MSIRDLFILFITLLLAVCCFTANIAYGAELINQADKDCLQLITSSENSLSLHFQLPELQHQTLAVKDERFDLFTLNELPDQGYAGFPQLPSIVRMILIPPQSGVDLIIHDISTRTISDVNPLPRQPEAPTSSEFSPINRDAFNHERELVRDDDAYTMKKFYPPQIARLGQPAILRGNRIIPVIITPLRWNPDTKELEIIESLDFELDFNSDLNRSNLVRNPQRNTSSRNVNRMLESLLTNPPPQRDDVSADGSIAYVIGTGGNWDDAEAELQPLIEWRRRMGWSVQVIAVENVDAQGIKDAIQDAYDDEQGIPPEYIVICGDTEGQFSMGFWDAGRGAHWPYESDHNFTELEGNDIIPDATVGRLVFTDLDMLRTQVNKTLRYESQPFLGEDDDEPGWQKRAAVVASDARCGTSSIDLCRWYRNLALDYGFTNVNELYWSNNDPRPNPSQFIHQNINSGLSVFLFRGWVFMNGFHFDEVMRLQNDEMLPLVILATCNSGDYAEQVANQFYYTERFLFNPDGGAIGAIGSGGATHTAYNNLLSAGILRGIFVEDIHSQGWALMRGKLALLNHYANLGDIDHPENPGAEMWWTHYYIYNLMGDPAVDLFTDVPAQLAVSHPEVLRQGESRFETVVQHNEDDSPVVGAAVCLYKPGEFQLVEWTDDEGRAQFVLDPDLMQDGEVQFTVSGHNLYPCQEDFEIVAPDNFLGVAAWAFDDDNEGPSRGDDDGTANPAERLELTVDVGNFGDQAPQGAVTLVLSSQNPEIRLINAEDQFEAAPDPGEALPASFVVEIGGGFTHGLEAAFDLEVSAGDDTWRSSLAFPVTGPRIEAVDYEWDGDALEPGNATDFSITIANYGAKDSPALTAVLTSFTEGVVVQQGDNEFDEIPIHEQVPSENLFHLQASAALFGGSRADLVLDLTAENGFQTSAVFSVTVGEADENQPFGPDDYGYVCFDDTDEGWLMQPAFNWTEIDPTLEGEDGVDTEMEDNGEEEDQSVVIDLPFNFRYYGEDFDVATICTNGWLAFGDQGNLTSFRNRRLPDGESLPAMLCPFWDELITGDDGGVYYWFDEANHQFIVEWSNMLKYAPRDQATETFQIVLYDSEFYPTVTGDGVIDFMYLEVEDNQYCYQQWDVPYASVGITSPDLKTGMQYTYWRERHSGAAPLENERTIRFTTEREPMEVGVIEGLIVDQESGDPLAEVLVTTNMGDFTTTNDTGFYSLSNLAIFEDNPYELTASIEGWNDKVIGDIWLEAGDTARIDFEMLRPEFLLSDDGFEVELEIGALSQINFSISNPGSGELEWSVEKRLHGEADPWTLSSFIPAENVLADADIRAAVFAEDRYYVAGDNHDSPTIYILDREGALIDTFPQPGDDRGMLDLAWDGELLWGCKGNVIYGFSLEGQIADSVEKDGQDLVAIAWDDEQEWLWYANEATNITAMDRGFDDLVTFSNPGMLINGLAFWEEDPDSLPLYVSAWHEDYPNGAIFKASRETDYYHFVSAMPGGDSEPGSGGFITCSVDPYEWNFITCVASYEDGSCINIWQIQSMTTWMDIEPDGGIIESQGETGINLKLDASGLMAVDYPGELVFTHSALGGETIVTIDLSVDETVVPGSGERTLPSEFRIAGIYPNPFNSMTKLQYELPEPSLVNISLFDLNGQLVKEIVNSHLNAGVHNTMIDGSDLASGVYIASVNASGKVQAGKVLLLK